MATKLTCRADILAVLAELTAEEKLRLLGAVSSVTTAAMPAHGIPAIHQMCIRDRLSPAQADEVLRFIGIGGSNDEVLAALEAYLGRDEMCIRDRHNKRDFMNSMRHGKKSCASLHGMRVLWHDMGGQNCGSSGIIISSPEFFNGIWMVTERR